MLSVWRPAGQATGPRPGRTPGWPGASGDLFKAAFDDAGPVVRGRVQHAGKPAPGTFQQCFNAVQPRI
jgi:hypothetical protein